SLLTQIIVLGLFLLFIKNSYIDTIDSVLGELSDLVKKADIEALVNSWMIAGVVGTATVTASMDALSVMVSDKQEKIDYDYTASSVKSSVVVLSYFSGAVLCALITGLILLTAGLVFLALTGTFVLTAVEIISMYGLVVLGSVSGTVVLMTIISFFKKSSTFSAFSVMVSAAIGFVVGAYIPVSQFGETTQTIVNLVPGSQITALMRQMLVSPTIENISKSLAGKDHGQFKEAAEQLFAIRLNLFGNEVDTTFMLIYSAAAIILFIALNIVLFRFSSRRKS
ncbi:MAG: hypothetical protein IJR57_09695, partial [Ruminococcus sp.]|nr:hypothetical protein [Ruminococcus sp.]